MARCFETIAGCKATDVIQQSSRVQFDANGLVITTILQQSPSRDTNFCKQWWRREETLKDNIKCALELEATYCNKLKIRYLYCNMLSLAYGASFNITAGSSRTT